ncbi:MAG: 3-isopropylmalate dehydratase [Gemmataceae bacterium]|nr:3-isopropylmalate dehydratase [Gemmataceae bacterium]
MSKIQDFFQGKAYVLGDNIDTDQIIPAQYLTYNPAIPEEYKQFGKYALSSVPQAQAGLPKGHIPFHTDDEFVSPYKFIVAGKNFGCGSSREHAPVALDAAGIQVVIAQFYARIFFRNVVNGGYLVPFETGDRLCEKICTGDELRLETAATRLINLTTQEVFLLKPLGEVAPILQAGGIFPYARSMGMLKS